MSQPNNAVPKVVWESLKSSGFPFQTAVAEVIRQAKGWSIQKSEYPWRGRANEDRFLDLVATNGEFFITVECKKTRKETLTFLRPLGLSNTDHVEEFRCLHATRYETTPLHAHLFCETWAISPNSPSSEFCIVSTSNSGKDQRMLERDASLVVGATDAFAQDARAHMGKDRALSPPYWFLPVIVTNAKLYTALYRPSDISLETGEFRELPKDIDEAPWVRFSKAFTAGKGRDTGPRSVFVVSSTAFGEFLDQHLEISPRQPADPVSVPVDYSP